MATNIHTMESRNLLPNQLRLLGESEYRPRDPGQYRHSAAYINSVIFKNLINNFFNYFQSFFIIPLRFDHLHHQKALGNYMHISLVINLTTQLYQFCFKYVCSHHLGFNFHSLIQSHPMITKFQDDSLQRKDRRSLVKN